MTIMLNIYLIYHIPLGCIVLLIRLWIQDSYIDNQIHNIVLTKLVFFTSK